MVIGAALGFIGRTIAGSAIIGAGSALLKKAAPVVKSAVKLPPAAKVAGGAGAGIAFQVAADNQVTPGTIIKGGVAGLYPIPYTAGLIAGGVENLYSSAKNAAISNPVVAAAGAGALVGYGAGKLGGDGDKGTPVQYFPPSYTPPPIDQNAIMDLIEHNNRMLADANFQNQQQMQSFYNSLLQQQNARSPETASTLPTSIVQRVTVSGNKTTPAKKPAKKKAKPKKKPVKKKKKPAKKAKRKK